MTPDIVQALVKTIEIKDASTAAHTWRVILYTRALAEAHDLGHDEIERLTVAAALHDVGKIEIPDDILRKPGPLTASERATMQTHAPLGHERLTRMGETDPLLLHLVRHHHERWDGAGYPDRLAGEAIPLAARFFAVIDSFDAMTSLRPYRSDVGPEAAERAIVELKEGVGTRYAADAVGSFERLYRTGKLRWILEYFNDRCAVPEYAAPGRAPGVMRSARGG